MCKLEYDEQKINKENAIFLWFHIHMLQNWYFFYE